MPAPPDSARLPSTSASSAHRHRRPAIHRRRLDHRLGLALRCAECSAPCRTSVILTFVARVIFFLPFPGWQKLVGFVTSATVLSFGSGSLALIAMRKQLPQQERPLRLPVGQFIAYLGFLSSKLLDYWSGWETTWKRLVAVVIGYIVLVIHELRYRASTPKLEFRYGAWVPAWLIGLAMISYLGEYPNPTEGAGNIGLIGFGWAIQVLAAFSDLILWMATALCLPQDRMEAHLADPASGTPAGAKTTTND